MESKTKNKKSRQQLEAMVRMAFNGMGLAAGDDAVAELKEGWFNVAYNVKLADGRESILKIAPPPSAEVLAYEKNIMETEVASMRLVRSNPAIPVPQVYFFDQTRGICDSDYFFMEKLPGDNLVHVEDSLPPETLAKIEFKMGEIVREINAFEGSSYFGYPGNPALRGETWREAFLKIIDAALADGSRRNVEYGCGYDEIRSLVSRHSTSLDSIAKPCLVHWDSWDSNLLVKDGKISGIIDFERSLWAEPLMEAIFRTFGKPEATSSMRGYGKTVFSFEEQQRLQLYELYLGLVMNTECYYRNYDNDFAYKLSYTLLNPSIAWLKAN